MLARDPSPPPLAPLPAESVTLAEPAHGNESYIALVWRRLKRSWTGMAGLFLVVLLLVMAVFAEFLAPMDPKATDVAFAPPQVPVFHDKDGNFVARPRVYALADSADLDPVTFQPIVGSMAVGDVYVTATFMMVLSATLIVGNIIADMLLAMLDPRVREFGRA